MTGRVDQEVVRRFAAGDDAAFSEIYRAYSGPMFSIALRTLGRHDTAADAVQQAFVLAWKASASFAPEADVAPWLFTITRRTAIDLWRRERRDVLTDDDTLVDESTPGPSLESAWEASEVRCPWRRFPKRSVRSFGCTTTTV
ncbi:MAG: RNA polymerase sigma factor [Geodermatophilaceae bacterium]|nr:RNA polymerase sigma factor [Geodermatophilaceae bacterium]